MCRTRFSLATAAIAAAAACACTPSSGVAEWPARPVRLIVPYAAGSAIDLSARLYAPLLAERWRRSVVVDNRPGGDGTAGVQAFVVGKDPHTLLLAPIGVVTVLPLLHDRLPYDAALDLVPISAAARVSMGIAVATDVSVHSLPALIELVRRRPGHYLWSAAPGLPEMVFKAFLALEKLQMKHVAYRDSSSAVHDFTAGRVHVLVSALATMNTPLESGVGRLLAVTNSARAPAAPEIPTAREAGYPTLTVDGLFGFYGGRDMPADLRQRLASDVQRAAEDRTLASRLAKVGLIAAAGTADELASATAEQQRQVDAIAGILELRQPGRESRR